DPAQVTDRARGGARVGERPSTTWCLGFSVGAQMAIDLQEVLPRLLPKAIAWAEARAEDVLRDGLALAGTDVALARGVGVRRPEPLRGVAVRQIPLPDAPELRRVALASGMLSPWVLGLTLGYAIYLRRDHKSARLLSHECRHVHQYEAAGSIAAFLPGYL